MQSIRDRYPRLQNLDCHPGPPARQGYFEAVPDTAQVRAASCTLRPLRWCLQSSSLYLDLERCFCLYCPPRMMHPCFATRLHALQWVQCFKRVGRSSSQRGHGQANCCVFLHEYTHTHTRTRTHLSSHSLFLSLILPLPQPSALCLCRCSVSASISPCLQSSTAQVRGTALQVWSLLIKAARLGAQDGGGESPLGPLHSDGKC